MDNWERQFDAYLQDMFGISINDTNPDKYRALSPFDAAMIYGIDFNLDRIDCGWNG